MIAGAGTGAGRGNEDNRGRQIRLGLLVCLAASAPLGDWLGLPLGGATHHHRATTLALFDVLLCLALGLVLVGAWRRGGWRAVRDVLGRAPAAGWVLLGLALWSWLFWQRAVGGQQAGAVAAARKLVTVAEYGLLGLLVFAELAACPGAARWAIGALAASLGASLLFTGALYFGGRPDFDVGGFLENRNFFGALAAVAVPFLAALAVSGRDLRLRAPCGALAAGLLLVATSGGALLGASCGVLAVGAMLRPRNGAALLAALLAVLAIGQMLPRRNLGAALESVRMERTCPKTGKRLLAMRYVRAGAEINVLRAPFRREDAEPRLLFGLGIGNYTEPIKRFRPGLDDRERADTDRPEHFDILSDEPGTFNLFGTFAAELGIPGFLAIVWLFLALGRGAAAAWQRAVPGSVERAWALGAVGAVIGAALASPLSSVWVRGAGPVLAVIVGVALAGARLAPQKEDTGPGAGADEGGRGGPGG